MKLIIDIPEECIPTRQDLMDIQIHFIDRQVVEVSGFGFTVLPESHGDLIDKDELWDLYHGNDYDFYEAFDNVTTIIGADGMSE